MPTFSQISLLMVFQVGCPTVHMDYVMYRVLNVQVKSIIIRNVLKWHFLDSLFFIGEVCLKLVKCVTTFGLEITGSRRQKVQVLGISGNILEIELWFGSFLFFFLAYFKQPKKAREVTTVSPLKA